MPASSSLSSSSALPPVSCARVESVSCWPLNCWRWRCCVDPLKMPDPRGADVLASPPGGRATSPRASIG
jgi:hypothetical protein